MTLEADNGLCHRDGAKRISKNVNGGSIPLRRPMQYGIFKRRSCSIFIFLSSKGSSFMSENRHRVREVSH